MGVACPNAQLVTSEQEDDLEHTGLSFFSHSQRQHPYLTGSCAQAQGTSSASSPEYSTGFPSTRDGMQRPPLALL